MKSSRIVLEKCLRSASTPFVRNPTFSNSTDTINHSRQVLLRLALRSTSSSTTSSSSSQRRNFSSVATQSSSAWEEIDPHFPDYYHENEHHTTTITNPTSKDKHCETCTCDNDGAEEVRSSKNKDEHDPTVLLQQQQQQQQNHSQEQEEEAFPCGNPHHEDSYGILPPALPEPAYSVHKRVLPSTLIASSSPLGRKYLLEAMTNNSAESYFCLMEQFVNQSDPAFCGVTTLLMVLNAMCVDPQVRWRGGWRYYGSEDVLLDRCCLSAERIRRNGVTLEEFRLLGRCHGLSIDLKRPIIETTAATTTTTTSQAEHTVNEEASCGVPKGHATLEEFRNDIRHILTQGSGSSNNNNSILVVSFSRASLGQTGDGHFSPLAAYHESSDSVLLLDVARFKYTPYWVPMEDLYHSMEPHDPVTNQPRGWFLLQPPHYHKHSGPELTTEDRRPAELVPQVGDGDACPVGKVKVEFCKANNSNTTSR